MRSGAPVRTDRQRKEPLDATDAAADGNALHDTDAALSLSPLQVQLQVRIRAQRSEQDRDSNLATIRTSGAKSQLSVSLDDIVNNTQALSKDFWLLLSRPTI